MKSPDTFLQIASESLDSDNIVKNVFPSNFGITEKKIWFWSTFNNELRVSFDITRRYMVSKFVKQEGKKRETEDMRHYWPSHFCVFLIFFLIKNGLSLQKTVMYLWIKTPYFYKNSNLWSILVICQKLWLIKIETLIYKFRIKLSLIMTWLGYTGCQSLLTRWIKLKVMDFFQNIIS